MIFWVKASETAEISTYIEGYWFIEKTDTTSGNEYPKLNPDPSAHLILSPPAQRYYYDLNPGIAQGKGSHWLFPHQATFELDHSQAFSHLGIKFHPGALWALGITSDTGAALDTVKEIHLSDVLVKEFTSGLNPENLIATARINTQQCCEQLDAMLLPWLEKGKMDNHVKLTQKVLPLLNNTPISELSKKVFCSQRTLERSFNKTTGLTPKQCQSMIRLEALLEYLHQRNASDIDWVDVAYQFGFSDQPHLIRSLKQQIGLTPSAYSKDRGLTIDVYGGISSI